MRVLVLGGAGYIGSHAVYQLIDDGHEAIVVDNLVTGHSNAVPPEATFYVGDIRDRAFLNTVFTNETIDAVLHFAASSLVGESMEQPLTYFDNNVFGTQMLLQVMQQHGVNKIVFSSTAATYGEPSSIPITEDMATNPESTYGETKRMMENMMKWCDRAFGLRYVSLRYFNVAGARKTGEIGEDHQPETHLIPLILQVPLNQRDEITIFGNDYPTLDGTCIRDYLHVEDLIDAHMLALTYLTEDGESDIFNLGSGHGFSVKEIIDTARQVTQHPIPAVVGDRRNGDPSKLVASSEKARTKLGWNPKRNNIHQIIQDAWNWHHHHPTGYRKDV
ncbi:UDP-glucose 4-epimerase [Paraliobacillus ryukyuensis]|uniref:UDP-glucose 4-epimerase n=1 Tax=Paraliobacillus ryukyuensis TaxID=200904 RepID=A0A366EEI1_9BACI|nr:UDP-glucose 4-epimerase GalE [Paraliobacillus ryukyuensis]RBP00436.1 UDP-galactose 4-epimerase [Paraliobacillus ryukyuensis]